MSDYIKRENAIKAMARGLGIPYTDFIDVAERCMDDIPTADVVEVVRCKDCRWFNKIGCAIEITDKSDAPADNDYCSFGERADT